MAELISFQRPDGAEASGWFEADDGGPGIVLVQEWWGVNDQIKGIGDQLARAGYRVLIPDLYRGAVTVEAAEAQHLLQGLDFVDAATQDVRGAALYLKQRSEKVGVVGYCMGGALALLAAMRVSEIDAAVPYYGAPQGMADEAPNCRIPVLGHFALKDGFFTPEMVREYETKMNEAGVDATFYWYDAGHAFCNEDSEAFDQKASELAWERTLEFLAKCLK